MDELHHRDDWPLVIERKPVPMTHAAAPVSPEDSDDEASSRMEDTNGGAARVSEDGQEGHVGSESPAEISPMQSSRSSLEIADSPPNDTMSARPDQTPSLSEVDELYEDDDEHRDIITPIPSAGLHMGADHSNPFDAEGLMGRALPTSTPQPFSSSILKDGSSPRTHLRRTPSITASIPRNRQRVRYSWQSVQDEEHNRPRINVIKLVSNTATASAGFPQGEAFGFSISAGGRRIAAYNSARLYILQTEALPVGISQDYALKRRPLAVEIVDEGNTIAILADEYTVNVYDLEHQLLHRIKTIKLDNPTTCIALSPTGGLLAAGYEGGVEIFSLAASALATDRRAVRSQKVDRLIFSRDASTLVGTTTRINASSTVVISVPVFPTMPNGVPTHEELKEAWCTELLQPENIRNSSHATFMCENREPCNDRLFAWNGLQETFGILRIPDMMYSNLDFPVVINPPLSTLGGLGAAIHCCPDVDENGDAVAMIVNDRTIRLYLVPRRSDDSETIVEAHSIDHELDEGYGCPFSDVRWVQRGGPAPPPLDYGPRQVRGRLIVASPGAVIEPEMKDEIMDVEDLEGGRIIMFDFDSQQIGQPGQTFSLTLGGSPPQVLEEPDFDVAHEVAIMRRRTVNQNKSSTLNQRPITLGRSATSSGNRAERTLRTTTPTITPSSTRRNMASAQADTKALPGLTESSEAMEPFEEPYAQNAPRSQASLQRAATNVQRHRFQALEEKNQEHVSVDSTGNFLALPEYTEEPNAPLPSRFRAMAGLDGPALPLATKSAAITSSGADGSGIKNGISASAPNNTSGHGDAEEAFATAQNTQILQQSAGKEQSIRPSAPESPSISFGQPSRSMTMPATTSSDTTQSARPMQPRFMERAYGNAPFNPLANGPPPGLIGDWENVAPLVPSQIDRPLTARQASIPTQKSLPSMNGALRPEAESWDAATPFPGANHSPSSMYTRPPLSGPQHRFSTPQLNSAGHSTAVRDERAAYPRAPSSAGPFATSAFSPNSPSFGDPRLPPHMQAFRQAAAETHTSPALPYHQAPHHHIPEHNSILPAINNGSAGSAAYPITAWHPPAPSATPQPRHPSTYHYVRANSISNGSAYAPTTATARSKSSGFFRRSGTKKSPNLLFGPEFANQQPGARPATQDSEEYGRAKSMFETRSIFTMKTKRGETRCTVM